MQVYDSVGGCDLGALGHMPWGNVRTDREQSPVWQGPVEKPTLVIQYRAYNQPRPATHKTTATSQLAGPQDMAF